MNDLIRRRDAAQATIDRFHGKPLAYGRDDCVRMAVFCLRKLGVRVSLLKAGSYRSELGAARALRRTGFATLAEAVDAQGLPRIAPAMALPGDLVGLPAPNGQVGLAVAVGNGRVLAFWETAQACTVIQPLEYVCAWRAV